MSGAKIMVFKLNELVRTAIFAAVGLALIIALVLFLIPRDKNEQGALYVPGTYASQIVLHAKPVNVFVTVSDKAITDIQMSELAEDQAAFYPLLKPTLAELSKDVIRFQTTSLKITDEKVFTSQVLLRAIDTALLSAARAE